MFIQLFDQYTSFFQRNRAFFLCCGYKEGIPQSSTKTSSRQSIVLFSLSIVTLIVLLSNSSYATGQYISCQEWKYQRCCMERDNRWNPQGRWLFIQNNWKGICYAFRPYNGMHYWDIFHIFSLLLLLVLYFFTFFLPELSCQMSGHYFGWDLSCLMLLITIDQALRL